LDENANDCDVRERSEAWLLRQGNPKRQNSKASYCGALPNSERRLKS